MKKQNSLFLAGCSFSLLFLAICSYWQPFLIYGFPLIGLIVSFYLWRHAPSLINLKETSRKVDVYRSMVFLSAFVLVLFFLTFLLSYLPAYKEIAQDIRYFIMIFFVVMYGNNAPKIPFNKTLGLRVSWTLYDEATWRYAHRMIGYCSIPCTLWMIVTYIMKEQSWGYLGFACLMALIPSIMSYVYNQRREKKR